MLKGTKAGAERGGAALARVVSLYCLTPFTSPPLSLPPIHVSAVESVSAIPKWKGKAGGVQVINMEWGGFGSRMDSRALPFTGADASVDHGSPNVGQQRFEKMIGGLYLGELVRYLLLSLVAEGALIPREGREAMVALSVLQTPHIFTGELLSTCGE